jgi:hypothetical protein
MLSRKLFLNAMLCFMFECAVLSNLFIMLVSYVSGNLISMFHFLVGLQC